MHLPGLDAEGLGHAGMVGAVEVDGEVAFIVAGLLAGLDPAEHAVGEHDHLQRHVAAHDGFQLAAGEAEAAVAHDRDHHGDRKSTRLNSSHLVISYAVFCLKNKMYTRIRVTIHASMHHT